MSHPIYDAQRAAAPCTPGRLGLTLLMADSNATQVPLPASRRAAGSGGGDGSFHIEANLLTFRSLSERNQCVGQAVHEAIAASPNYDESLLWSVTLALWGHEVAKRTSRRGACWRWLATSTMCFSPRLNGSRQASAASISWAWYVPRSRTRTTYASIRCWHWHAQLRLKNTGMQCSGDCATPSNSGCNTNLKSHAHCTKQYLRIPATLHCCTAALLHCCTAALLHCCTARALQAGIDRAVPRH